MRSGASSLRDVSPGDPQVDVMIYGVLGSLFLAGALAWFLMRPVASTFRRFGLSMVAALGGFLWAMVLTYLVRELVAPAALLALAVVALGAVAYFSRRARAPA